MEVRIALTAHHLSLSLPIHQVAASNSCDHSAIMSAYHLASRVDLP